MSTAEQVTERSDWLNTSAPSISAEAYHKLPGISNSKLSVFIDDPREYWYQFLSGMYVEKQRDHFDFGAAVHDICLLNDLDGIAVVPQFELDAKNVTKQGKQSTSKATTYYQDSLSDFETANYGKTLLSHDDYMNVLRCVDAVRKHPIAGELLSSPGYTERCYAWESAEHGFALRCRPDKLCSWNNKNIVVDLKTTTDTVASRFVRSIDKFGYARQEAFYRKVLAANSIEVDAFVFIAVKDSPPHCVDCYTIRGDWLESAASEVDSALLELARRTRDNDWESATANSVVELAPPNWLKYKGDYSL